MTQIQTSTPIPSLSHLNDIKIKRIIPGAKTVIILDVPTDVLLNPSVNIERHESVLITNQNTESEINEHHFDFKIKDAVLIPASKYSDLGFIFHEFDSVWNYNFNAFTQSPLSKVPSVDAGNHFFLIKRIDTRTMYPADDAPLTLETQGALNNMGYSSIDQQPFYTTKDVKVVIGEKFNEFGEIITYELELYGPDMIYASLFNMVINKYIT
ncbi:hypothetical protein AX774_g5430 [Zancudomyces culisetae]|uniref:Uncharacterized protein n=1 Tax=Zancudomyces culisetae TaxID=1213189 RepID=A0A1R1PJI2_ZANCU|nr:hypothetical protein AX774_g5430 [Zancudomyces culisetae]|eukprot:OMH81118.1 hypothetical protein AX774_g5430 [Zancudomyces culisetae]